MYINIYIARLVTSRGEIKVRRLNLIPLNQHMLNYSMIMEF